MLKNLKNDKNLLVIALIAVVNALGYGIIIPILYSYSHRFGMSDFANGLLFAAFSAAQFFATPVIGMLSDKYGRKPLLLLSLSGTVGSFVLMALARNPFWLFAARILDGITAGNIPVATAVISDTQPIEKRAAGFGLIGASFGFGFVFGPAISALTVGFGPSIPFWIAAIVTLIAVIMTAVILPETNKHMGEVHNKKLFDFVKLGKALVDPNVGLTLLVSGVYSIAFALFIFAYQPVSVKVLHLTASQISINFTMFGIMGLLGQAVVAPNAIKKFGEKKGLTIALILVAVSFVGLAFSTNLILFMIFSIMNSLSGALVGPVINVLLSREVDARSQGEIMGISSSYLSLGMIIGPIIGGLLASFWIPLPMLIAGLVLMLCAYLSLLIAKKPDRVGLI